MLVPKLAPGTATPLSTVFYPCPLLLRAGRFPSVKVLAYCQRPGRRTAVIPRIHVYKAAVWEDRDGALHEIEAKPAFDYVRALRPREQDPSR